MKKLKKTTHDSTEPVDKQHYKKRYLLRKQQEAEAEKDMKSLEAEPVNYRVTEPHLWEEAEKERNG